MELLNYLVTLFTNHGYAAVFGVLLLCGFGLPIPEDITLVAGGVISGLDNSPTQIHIMFLVGMAGVMVGDSVMFLAGYWKGESILKSTFVSRIVTQERYEAVQVQFEKYGKWVVFMARFMPGLRAAIFMTAGISKRVSFLRFFLTDGLAAIISVPIWVYLGYYFASNFEILLEHIHKGQMLVFSLLGVGILVGLYYYFKKKKVT
jgi:membrane protein DedA with SNARE-associated domain